MIDDLADFEQDLDLLVWGVSLVHTRPPLLDPLQDHRVGNSNSGRPSQLLDPSLLQQTHVALETFEGAVGGAGGVNAGVEVGGDRLQSHLLKGKLYQGVYGSTCEEKLERK